MDRFSRLQLWMDPVIRPGPEAMAVDEWLLETAEIPVLRIYGWEDDWASVGYFGKIADARAAISGVNWVRRWTGGGLVDHRADWTYTLVVPHTEKLANARGAESYRWIHAALARAISEEGTATILGDGGEKTGAALCFENPVCHDLIGPGGRKLAGAGQRRTRLGLLHQGSVALAAAGNFSERRARCLAGRIASSWQIVTFDPDATRLASKVAARYANEHWLQKR